MTNTLPSFSVGCWLVFVLLAGRAVDAQWVKKPSKELLERTPGLVHETFESEVMNTAVGYSVVLPPSYANGEQRYPVVYWLHGGGGDECSSLFTSNPWRELYKTGHDLRSLSRAQGAAAAIFQDEVFQR